MSNEKSNLSYYGLYLKGYLRDTDDPRQDDIGFINGRADTAEKTFEEARRDGRNVDQAEELAMSVLMEGLTD